jgi:hypothetical protein
MKHSIDRTGFYAVADYFVFVDGGLMAKGRIGANEGHIYTAIAS